LRRELHGGGPEQSQRMLREAQAMARLSDPHVVAVYDVGLHQGSVYVVMEYVDGATLAAWLRDAQPSRVEILKVFDEAGRGLLAAHDKGLVHRDFKPENVLVARDGRARVTDFGLARESEHWLEARAGDDQTSTEPHAPTRGLVGTPAYMAPELFEGGRASPQSDQFAFCVALFVALFEKHPFKAGEGIALGELITRVRAHTLQVPSLESAEDERLFAVLRRGLSADPGARHPDISALLSALTGALRGKARRRLAWGTAVFVAAAVPLAWALGFDLTEAPKGPPIATSSAGAALAISAPLTVDAPPAPTASSSAASSAPSASAAPRGPATPAKRRPEPKPGDVRYKDWLKEPF
jgi:serine/threonine protein kinase